MQSTERRIKIYGLIIGIILFIALIAGLSYAYYQAMVSNNTTVTGTAAGPGTLQLTVTNLSTGATGNLIPMDSDLTILNQAALGYGNSSGNQDPTKQCIDKYGYTVCKVYQISITNTGTTQTIITGGVTQLSGANTPNLTCTVMSDNHTVSTIKKCVGSNTLANKVTLAANATNTYYVMVYINNINGAQTDNGTFNGTVEFNTGSGGIKASFYPTAEEKIESLFTKTGTVTEDPSGDAIVLDVDTTHSLIKDQRGNIRYYGADPSNYIYFNCDTYPDTNCETWRIIGIVDGKVKLMRGFSIYTHSWDTSASSVNSGNGINQWGESVYSANNNQYSGADLMKLLNPGYENNQDLDRNGNTITVNNSLYYNSGSGNCYSDRNNYSSTTTCNFTDTGLKNDATRSKITVTTYYTGGWNSTEIYPHTILENERGTAVKTDPSDGVTRTTSWIGRIAVPYPSDYGYAADLSLCTGKNLNQYNDSTCTSNNWMKNIMTYNANRSGSLLTPYSVGDRNIWNVFTSGLVLSTSSASGGYAFTPVLYLSSDEIIESGEGTSANPYRLSA